MEKRLSSPMSRTQRATRNTNRGALRVGLIGCGRIAQQVHIPALLGLPQVTLAALVETDPQRLDEARRLAPQASVCADYHELLDRSEIEAVVICLPNSMHAEVALAALECGKHLYLEKPLATGLEEANPVLTTWHESGLIGMMGFNYRFNPLYQSLRDHIRTGNLGRLVGVRSTFAGALRNQQPWKQTRHSGGGVLLDLASHHIDLIHFLFDRPVRQVSASLQSLHGEDDNAMVQLYLEDGVLVQSFFSNCAVDDDRFEVFGQEGKISLDRYHSCNIEVRAPSFSPGRLGPLWNKIKSTLSGPRLIDRLIRPAFEPSFQKALTYFADTIRDGRKATPDLRDGYRSLAVVTAAEQAAATGPVEIPASVYEK